MSNIQSARGTKRKFDFDATTAEKLAREAEEAALRQIEREQAEALKHKLPDFWLPSLTPTYTTTGPPTSLSDVKLQSTCRGGNPAHHLTYVGNIPATASDTKKNYYRRKNLIPVNFTFDTSSNKLSSSVSSTPATSSSSDAKPKKSDEPLNAMCPSCKKELSNNTLMFRA